MKATIRPALPDEASAIAGAHIAAWRETYTGLVPDEVVVASTKVDVRRALWSGRLAARDKAIFVVAGDDAVLGFACASPMADYPRDRLPIPGFGAYLDALYLLKAVQGRGLGRALLARIAARLIDADIASLALHVLATNPSVAFYRHCGAAFARDEPIDPWGTFQSVYGWDRLDALAGAKRTESG